MGDRPAPMDPLAASQSDLGGQPAESRIPSDDGRDREATERDRQAGERDREADERDREADERDREANAVERQVPGEVVDLRARRNLTLLRHQAGAERQQAALDRAAAGFDRGQAARDRLVAAVRETPPSEGDEAAAVTAHGLLSSSAVVAMGITTLQAHWDAMPAAERLHLLKRMLSHASFVDERLKSLTQGRLSLVASSPSST